MVKKKMRKRVFIIMLLPLIILLWIIGWSLLFTGSQDNPKTTQTPSSKSDGIQITVGPLEEYPEQTHS